MKVSSITPAHAVKIAILAIWVGLFTLLLVRDYLISPLIIEESTVLERAGRIDYQGVYFKDEKIGFVRQEFTPTDGGSILSQEADMRLNISGESYPVLISLAAELTSNNLLRSFSLSFTSTFYTLAAQGRVVDSDVHIVFDSGEAREEQIITLDEPPFIATSRRAYLLTQDMQPGKKYRHPQFDPISLTNSISTIEYRGKQRILIRDRVFSLHEFLQTVGGTRISFWLDDDGAVVKEESPAGFVFIREPQFIATSVDAHSPDILAGVAVKIIGEMGDIQNSSIMRYRLTLPDEASFDLSGGRQLFADGIVTITKETIGRRADHGNAACGRDEEYLAATPYIQADQGDIVDLAQTLTAGMETTLDKVSALKLWVFTNLEKRPVLGIPDALTTLRGKIGDCNEHSALFAALARAAAIPTKIAAGVVWQRDGFYYHAWNEVCIDDTWITLDTTTNQMPADLSHIRFVEGGINEQIRIGALLNQLAIEPLTENP